MAHSLATSSKVCMIGSLSPRPTHPPPAERGYWDLGDLGSLLSSPLAQGHFFQPPALGGADSALAGQISGHSYWGERLG